MGREHSEGRRRPARAKPSRPVLSTGTMVDHFKVMRLIGRGGMGEVYLARDTTLGRRAALKIVSSKALRSPDARAAFHREAQLTARFNHPNIVTLHAVGEHDGRPYVALEYLQGEDLGSRIAARAPSLNESLRIGLAVGRALEEAHRHGVLHLDLKPSNVVIPADGRPRVVDFGLSTTMRGPLSGELGDELSDELSGTGSTSSPSSGRSSSGASSEASSGAVWGTPVYTAPERWYQQPAQAATDIWALGVILYELFGGRLPFPNDSPVTTRDAIIGPDEAPNLRSVVDIPRPVADLVARCLSKAPEDRPSASDVVTTLTQVLGTARPRPQQGSPFRGLLPFEREHADLFFGRDAEIDAFVERVRHQPVLPVVGPTGAGKSSFVHAGVLPRLREQEPWVVLHMRPGRRPFFTLADRLRRRETESFGRSGKIPADSASELARSGHSGQLTRPLPAKLRRQTEEHAAILEQSPSMLALTLRTIAEEEDAKVALVIDQLEELCTMVDDDVRRRFMEAICAAADDPLEPVRVIFTVRDDFLGRLSVSPAVRDTLARVTVIMSLQETALEAIVRMPVEAMGFEYEDDALVSDIISAVAGEPGCLPLLQFAGQMLWERRDEGRRLLLRSAYERMGGVAGALAQHADEVLAGLTTEELRIARRLLLLLVSADRTRKVVGLEAIIEQLGVGAEPVLARLTKSRLLSVTWTRDAVDEGPRLELAHESLIHTWSLLSRWVDESREELGLLGDATAAAQLWDKRGRRPAELWQGDALHDAQRTLSRLAFDLPPLVANFIDASDARERARTRRRWVVLGTTFGLLLLVAGTAVFAALLVADKERVARQKRTEAEAQRQVATKQREVAQQQRAVALAEGARAALDRGRALEARAKLRMALEHDDGADARGLWWMLSANPALWQADVGSFGLTIAFAPDGQTIATGCQDVGLCLFDASTRAVRVLRGHPAKVGAVRFSPDGQRLVSADWDGHVLLWDVQTGRLEQTIDAHPGRIMAVAFDPTANLVASAGRDRMIRLWTLRDTSTARRLEGHRGAVEGVAFSPDGTQLVSASEDKTIRLWNATSGQPQFTLPHDAAIEDVVYSPRGDMVASACNDGTIHLWNPMSGVHVRTLPNDVGGIRGLSFDRTGTQLAAASYDGTLTVWDVDRAVPERSILAHQGSARAVAISPDARTLASIGYDSTARLWDLGATSLQLVEEGHAGPVRGADFSPDGSIVASGGFDHTVRLWDVETGEPLAVLDDHDGAVYGVDFSPDGERLASASAGGEVRVWNARTYKAERALRGHDASVYTVHFSPDSTRLASGSRDQTVRVWDVLSGEQTSVLSGHEHVIWAVRFDPQGERIASASWDYTVRVWDPATERQLHRFAHDSAAYGVDFLPTGQAVVSSSADKTVRRWDLLDSGNHQVISAAGRNNVLDVHPGGHAVVVAMLDGSARTWTLDGSQTLALFGHSSQVSAVQYSADGGRLATAADDGIVRVWEASSGRPHWRAPVLLREPAQLLSHRGWIALDDDDDDDDGHDDPDAEQTHADPDAEWVRQAVEHVRLADQDALGRCLCMRTYDDHVQLWDLQHDELRADEALPGLRDVRAVDGACVARSDTEVRIVPATGPSAPLTSEPAEAIGVGEDSVLVATSGRIRVFSTTGQPLDDHPAGLGVTALAQTEHFIVVGYRDGTLAALPRAPGGRDAASFFERAPPGPVTRLVPGPMDTIIAGYADGTFGLWSLIEGSNLARARLHGPIAHLVLHDQRLLVASDLGRFASWDLSVFYRDYCELLGEVWDRVPVIWDRGQAIARAPDRRHRCLAPGE